MKSVGLLSSNLQSVIDRYHLLPSRFSERGISEQTCYNRHCSKLRLPILPTVILVRGSCPLT